MIVRPLSQPSEPLTLEECYRHLRIDPIEFDSDGQGHRPDDDLILGLARAARQHCEHFTGLSLMSSDYELALDEWPEDGEIVLPRAPFLSVQEIRVSDDSSDWPLDESSYTVDDYSKVPYGILRPVSEWPAIEEGNQARIRFRTGPTEAILAAMLLLVGHWYANREAVGNLQQQLLPLGVEALLRPYRVHLALA